MNDITAYCERLMTTVIRAVYMDYVMLRAGMSVRINDGESKVAYGERMRCQLEAAETVLGPALCSELLTRASNAVSTVIDKVFEMERVINGETCDIR